MFRNNKKEEKIYVIEKAILKPYFKPVKKNEKGLSTYKSFSTDKKIIFPYDKNGQLIPIETMKTDYPGTYAYLLDYYDVLVPKCVSPNGKRDVPNATADTWYQYGRKQSLTSFNDTPKIIAAVLSKEPAYLLDTDNMLISSGGTAGYVAISQKNGSPYELEYIQAWLTNPLTVRYMKMFGSDFEGDFKAKGTFLLQTIPFVKIDFSDINQSKIYNRVIENSRKIYSINSQLETKPSKQIVTTLQRQKEVLIKEIENLISRVYHLDF